jgi:hypothetical protein
MEVLPARRTPCPSGFAIADSEVPIRAALDKYKVVTGVDIQQQTTLESLGLEGSESVTNILTALRRRTNAKTPLRAALEPLLLSLCRFTTSVSGNSLEVSSFDQ